MRSFYPFFFGRQYILLIFIGLALGSCKKNEVPYLSEFQVINPPEAKLITRLVSTADSIHLELVIYGNLLFKTTIDTVLTEKDQEVQLPVYLEIPDDVYLSINGKRRKVFIIPGKTTILDLGKDKDGQIDIIKYGGETAAANQFYKDRDTFLNTEDFSKLSMGIMVQEDIQQCLKDIDSLGNLRKLHLEEAYAKKKIPAWFYEYEGREISYDSYNAKWSGINYRAIMLGKTGERALLDTVPINLDIENPNALSNRAYWGFLSIWSRKTFCTESCYEFNDKGTESLLNVYIKAYKTLKNEKIKQIALTRAYSITFVSSGTYPDTLHHKFRSEIDTSYVVYLDSIFAKSSLAGESYPHFYLKNVEGSFISAQELKGKVLFISFWFVGCTPCYKEFPYENELKKKFAGQPFELVSICLNSKEEDWRATLKKYDLKGLQLYGNENWSKKLRGTYHIDGFPTMLLADRNGLLVGEKALKPSNPDLANAIQALIDETD